MWQQRPETSYVKIRTSAKQDDQCSHGGVTFDSNVRSGTSGSGRRRHMTNTGEVCKTASLWCNVRLGHRRLLLLETVNTHLIEIQTDVVAVDRFKRKIMFRDAELGRMEWKGFLQIGRVGRWEVEQTACNSFGKCNEKELRQ